MFKATVYVRMKKGLLDPQGTAIKGSLRSLDFNEITEVKVGKLIEVFLTSKNRDQAAKRIEEMSKKLLINPIIEVFSYDLEEIKEGKAK